MDYVTALHQTVRPIYHNRDINETSKPLATNWPHMQQLTLVVFLVHPVHTAGLPPPPGEMATNIDHVTSLVAERKSV